MVAAAAIPGCRSYAPGRFYRYGGKYFIGNAQIVAYLPQRINIGDSLTAKSGGFNFGLTFLGLDAFPRVKNFPKN